MSLQPRQTMQQRLMLAPNVTLALEVLRMPTLELRAYLERQLEENPLLEIEEAAVGELPPASMDGNDKEAESTPAFDEELFAHWSISGEFESGESEEGYPERATDQRLISPQSLHDALRLQLGCQALPPALRQAGEALITRLDDAGYLDAPVEELCAEWHVPAAELEQALRIIQGFDPPGVGARDLRECLLLQLEHGEQRGSLAHRIVQDHFPLFIEHKLGAIARAAGASPEAVSEAYECVKRLNPKPGRAFTNELPPSIVPDLVIHHRETYYDVELNDQDMPRVSVNRAYYRMLRDARTPSDAKEFLAGKLQKASWLIKAIDERNATLLSIARCLISLQRDFLEQGPQAIKPLTQAQVASLIGRHPSTVSRAITGKTIDTPCGIFRLEQLFASGVPQADDQATISDARIKSELRRLIDAEDPQRPLSDAALGERLQAAQITVARRTIAKYRAALKILPAHLRKRRS